MKRDHLSTLEGATTGLARPRAWLVFGDPLLAQDIGRALEQAGWEIAGVAGDIAGVERLALRGAAPELVVTGLRFRDGDGFQLMRLLARFATVPAVFIASREQRAVIRAAASLAQSCGLAVAGFAEQPVGAATIAAALDGYRRPVSSRRTASPELSRDELLSMFDRGALEPWLQPKVRLKTNEVVGFEALMRSSDCNGTLVMPDRLVGALARHYLLDQATLHMAARTVAFVADCLERGMAINASINVSMTSLSNLAFCQELAATVAAAGLDPSWITIEITETDAMTDLVSVIENTGRIRMLGFNLAIDDFGTAYASLMHLVRLPFSELKIERAFIHGIATDSGKQAILGACAGLGASLGLHVVAEGVETAEECAYARRAGCTQVQGYLVAHPMPVEQAMDWLARLPQLRFELPG